MYIDVLFALNFLMNLVLLFMTAVAVRLRVSLLRITTASAFLALYGTLAVVPELNLLGSFMGKILSTSPAILLLCKGEKGKVRWKAWIVFWLVSVSVGGALFAICRASSSAIWVQGSLYLNLSFWTVLGGIGGVYGLILAFCRFCQQRHQNKKNILSFALWVGEQRILFDGLLDTGCSLTVPVLGDPILLLSKSVLGDIPEGTFPVSVFTATGKCEIPVFYPKKLGCLTAGYQICPIPAIGITEEEFADGQFQAVFNPAMIEKGGNKNEKSHTGVVAKISKMFQREKRRMGSLYRRKRYAAPTSEQRRRGVVALSPEYAGTTAGDTENSD